MCWTPDLLRGVATADIERGQSRVGSEENRNCCQEWGRRDKKDEQQHQGGPCQSWTG